MDLRQGGVRQYNTLTLHGGALLDCYRSSEKEKEKEKRTLQRHSKCSSEQNSTKNL